MNDLETTVIPQEKFEFANQDKKITDVKFEDKPIGYFKDAWLRFKKNKASIFAAVIIMGIILFAIFVPLFSNKETTFRDSYYVKKAPRDLNLAKIGIADGGVTKDYNPNALVKLYAIGLGAEDWDGSDETLSRAEKSYYNPVLKVKKKGIDRIYSAKIDVFLEVGFIYRSIEQEEYYKILEWEEKNGLHVIYPLIDLNEYCADIADANFWYKTDKKGAPIIVRDDGTSAYLDFSKNGTAIKLEDNYMKDADGNLVYKIYTGGGDENSAQFKVRVLYYNYYRYLNGFEPEYIFGTDAQGYDLALRMAIGLRLSLLVAVSISLINFIIGAIYGSIEGFYGGLTDLTMERISDILSGIPFIVVATLFQIHLATKVGPIPSLIFAFVATGWIGTASAVRTQFYRFKNQEYVMAARTLGASDQRLIWKHIFPNSLGTLITSSVLVIPSFVFSESMLSFLGIVNLGGSKMTSLGTLLSDASSIWTTYPHLMIYPAIVISLLMISFNLFGNGLRDAFNPSLRGVEE